MGDFDSTTPVFPQNVMQVVQARFQMLWPATGVFLRPLHPTDLTQSIGIFPSDLVPDGETYEMPSKEPTIQRYIIRIQGFVKDTVEDRGIATHSVMAKKLRSVLYNDNLLAVGLNSLAVVMDGATERVQRRGILRHLYISNQIDGNFLYLSVIDYWLETENK